jgi:integral membrane sensor domain MASE1
MFNMAGCKSFVWELNRACISTCTAVLLVLLLIHLPHTEAMPITATNTILVIIITRSPGYLWDESEQWIGSIMACMQCIVQSRTYNRSMGVFSSH